MNKITLLSALFLLFSCNVGPDFKKVKTKADDAIDFQNTPLKYQEKHLMKSWWNKINDPLLTNYIKQLLNENLELEQSGERIIQARERLSIQRGARLPSISGDFDAARSFTSSSSNNKIFSNNYSAGINVSWQTDLFGKIRRLNESAKTEFKATIFDRDALVQSLIAELIRLRVAISSDHNSLELAKENASNRQKVQQLVQKRYKLGANNTFSSDLYLAKEDYNSAMSKVHQFESSLAANIYSFDVLLGQIPGTTTPLSAEFPLLPPPATIPTLIPADLLDRRPDLRASELRLRAANADIGVAIADLYPSFSISSSIGFTQDSSASLFTADRLAGSLIGGITTKLFQGGALRANIKLQESEARELSAQYANAVLNAVKEVETALKAEQELDKQLENIQKAVIAIQSAESISEERYLAGILTLNNFLNIKQRRYNIEQNWIVVQQQKWNNRLNLYLALGGDWIDDEAKESLKNKIIYRF